MNLSNYYDYLTNADTGSVTNGAKIYRIGDRVLTAGEVHLEVYRAQRTWTREC